MATTPELSALKAQLIEAGVRYCLGAYVDIHGVPKGKFVPVSHFEHFAKGSELYTGYALDGLGQQPNEDEISSVPDLERWVQVPWRKELAWFPADNHFHGQPYPLNTRVLLKKVLAEAAKLGFGFNLGIEAMSYYSWAPVFSSFGSNNRTNSIRVPMNGGRAECRNADSSCNPYLAAALLLAAGLEGVKEKLDPGRPHEENLYELTGEELKKAGVTELPRTLGEAVDAFEQDPFIESVLGPELKQEFVRYKRAEWEQYHQSVSQWEIDKYARLF